MDYYLIIIKSKTFTNAHYPISVIFDGDNGGQPKNGGKKAADAICGFAFVGDFVAYVLVPAVGGVLLCAGKTHSITIIA